MKKQIFTMVERPDKKWQIAIGNQLISNEMFNSRAEAVKYVNSKPWDLIINACMFFMDNYLTQKNQQNEKISSNS